MKFLILTLLTIISFRAQAESFYVDGRFILGRVFFDKGQDARLHISIVGAEITAVLSSPTSECVFEFGVGKLEKEDKETPFSKGYVAAYTVPLINRCRSMATNPIYLIIRKNSAGELTSVKVVNRNNHNRWTYFTTSF